MATAGWTRLKSPAILPFAGGSSTFICPGSSQIAGEQLGLTVRVDFFDDQIESIRRFDLDSLGSGETLPSVSVIDIKGQLPATGESTSIFSYLPADGIVALWAPMEIAEQSKSYFDRLPDVKGIYPLAALLKLAGQFTRMELSQFDQQAMMLGAAVRRICGSRSVPFRDLKPRRKKPSRNWPNWRKRMMSPFSAKTRARSRGSPSWRTRNSRA